MIASFSWIQRYKQISVLNIRKIDQISALNLRLIHAPMVINWIFLTMVMRKRPVAKLLCKLLFNRTLDIADAMNMCSGVNLILCFCFFKRKFFFRLDFEFWRQSCSILTGNCPNLASGVWFFFWTHFMPWIQIQFCLIKFYFVCG